MVPTQSVTAIKLRDTLVPKLPLGNPVSKAPALRAGKLELPVLNSQAGAWELARKARCTTSHEQRLNIRDAARPALHSHVACGNEVYLSICV